MRRNRLKLKLIALTLVICTVVFAQIPLTMVYANAETSVASRIDNSITVTISGLENGDQATLALSPEGTTQASTFNSRQLIESKGDSSITIEVPSQLADGYYQLLLETTDKYFRDPKGYYFQVQNSQIVNPQKQSFVIKLIPPSKRDYEPYRGPFTVSDSTAEAPDPKLPSPGETVYRAESFISLSAPAKLGISQNTQLNQLNQYGHYFTYASNSGCRAGMQVGDPGVQHYIPGQEFALDHIYVTNYSSIWMETGWCEVSWQGDYRYLFEYDYTTAPNWRILFQVPTGAYLQVDCVLYSGTTWISEWWNGSYWVQTGYVNLGYSSPPMTINGGELGCNDGYWPSMPVCYTTSSYLKVNGTWQLWNNNYPTGTVNSTNLHIHGILNYSYFYVSSN
jgi:hypothetical protein